MTSRTPWQPLLWGIGLCSKATLSLHSASSAAFFSRSAVCSSRWLVVSSKWNLPIHHEHRLLVYRQKLLSPAPRCCSRCSRLAVIPVCRLTWGSGPDPCWNFLWASWPHDERQEARLVDKVSGAESFYSRLYVIRWLRKPSSTVTTQPARYVTFCHTLLLSLQAAAALTELPHRHLQ